MPMRVIMKCIAEKYTTLKRNGYDNEKTSTAFLPFSSLHMYTALKKRDVIVLGRSTFVDRLEPK